MKTPVFLDYNLTYPQHLLTNELNIYDEDPIDLYTDPLTLDPPDIITGTKPYILAPRYYIEIHRPKNQPGPTIKIQLQKSPTSLLNNKVRVSLDPSIGWGINASYKVKYWEWIPNINLSANPSKKLVKTEYWYVPTLDCDYIARYPFDLRSGYWYPFDKWANVNSVIHPGFYSIFNPRRRSISIPVQRTVEGANVVDVITDVNGVKLFSFPIDTFVTYKDTTVTEVLPFNEETREWNFSKHTSNFVLTRNALHVDGGLLDGEVNTTIEYIEPLHPFQLVVTDCDYLLDDSINGSFY